MINRIMGVLTLKVDVFEEIEHDESATTEAAIIVAIVAVISAIGAFLSVQFGTDVMEQLSQWFGSDAPLAIPPFSSTGIAISSFIGTFVTWVLWSALTYFIGTNLFSGEATLGEMLRVLGYAQAPLVLNIVSFIPCVGWLIALAATIWSLVAGFIAIRQGLDIDNGKTAITVIISFLVALVVQFCAIDPIFGLFL